MRFGSKLLLWGLLFAGLFIIGLTYGVDPEPAVPDDYQYTLWGLKVLAGFLIVGVILLVGRIT